MIMRIEITKERGTCMKYIPEQVIPVVLEQERETGWDAMSLT